MRVLRLLGVVVPAAVLVACGSATGTGAGPGGKCLPGDGDRAEEFASTAILGQAPGLRLTAPPNVVLPCADDDGVGRVSQRFSLREREDVIRRYYVDTAGAVGWVLGKEHPVGYPEGPQICLENDKYPDAQLVVFMAPDGESSYDLFVEYHFGKPVRKCE